MGNVQSRAATGSGATLGLAFLADVTAGNFLSAGVGSGDDGDVLTDVADDTGTNFWQEARSATQSAQIHAAVWFSESVIGVATQVNASFSAAEFASNICINEYSGVKSSGSLDQSNTGGAFSNTVTTGNVTPTQANELVIAVCCTSQPGITWTKDADFDAERTPATGGNRSFQYVDDIIASTDTINSTHSNGGANGNMAAVIATFKLQGATLEQEGYRFYDDDGNEASMTALAAQDTPITRAAGVNTVLRVLVDATGDPASTQFQLEYKRDVEDVWRAVVAGSGDIQLAASTNIAASGEATTNRLAAPAAGTFIAGRIQDDENPADAVDPGDGQFTELAWCLQAVVATHRAQPTFVYQFRVTANGVPLDTYTVTPTWTIAGSRHLFGATH